MYDRHKYVTYALRAYKIYFWGLGMLAYMHIRDILMYLPNYKGSLNVAGISLVLWQIAQDIASEQKGAAKVTRVGGLHQSVLILKQVSGRSMGKRGSDPQASRVGYDLDVTTHCTMWTAYGRGQKSILLRRVELLTSSM